MKLRAVLKPLNGAVCAHQEKRVIAGAHSVAEDQVQHACVLYSVMSPLWPR